MTDSVPPAAPRPLTAYKRPANSIGFKLTTVLCDRCGRDWGSVFSVMERDGVQVGVCSTCANGIDELVESGPAAPAPQEESK
jgi:hypothetical protein